MYSNQSTTEMPENDHVTTNIMNQNSKPSTVGAHKNYSGILNYDIPVEPNGNAKNISNDTHGEHIFSKNKSLLDNGVGHQNDISLLHSNEASNRNDHHHKRDATLTAGAVGLASQELNNRSDNNNQSELDDSSHHDNTFESGLGTNTHHHEGISHPLHSKSSNDDDNHHKRDAAAAGLAAHELKKHHDRKFELGNNTHTGTDHPLHSGLDDHHTATGGNPLHSGFDDSDHTTDGNEHHYKRDAALGAGAAGIAGHEMKQHHYAKDKDTHLYRTSISSKFSADSSPKKKSAAVHDKPLDTGGDAHHIAEHPPLGLGGLTGKQPVGEVNFH